VLCLPDFTENSNNNEKAALEIWEINAHKLCPKWCVCVSVSLNEPWKAAFGCRDPV
jgi:hypothetical protein